MCTLTANGQATAMPIAAITTNLHQSLDVLAGLASQVPLDAEVLVDELTESDYLFLRKVAYPRVGVYARLTQHALAGRMTDAEDICEADLDTLLARQIDT